MRRATPACVVLGCAIVASVAFAAPPGTYHGRTSGNELVTVTVKSDGQHAIVSSGVGLDCRVHRSNHPSVPFHPTIVLAHGVSGQVTIPVKGLPGYSGSGTATITAAYRSRAFSGKFRVTAQLQAHGWTQKDTCSTSVSWRTTTSGG